MAYAAGQKRTPRTILTGALPRWGSLILGGHGSVRRCLHQKRFGGRRLVEALDGCAPLVAPRRKWYATAHIDA